MASTTADEIIDRRRLRRKVSFWRILAFVILAIALVGAILFSTRDRLAAGSGKDHIARVKITGVITNDEPMLKLLRELKEKEKVRAVILNISSPGGSTVGGEALFEAVRELSDKKPVATSIGTLAASAGYMIAAASDHIVARRSSIVGSIGVLFQYADVSELADKLGIKVKTIKSSPLKAEPNPFNPASEEAIAMIDRLIQDSYEWFVGLIVERRNMSRDEVLELADGSIFTGAQGLENGLIDAVGGEDTAQKWLEAEKGVSGDLEVVEYKPKRPGDSFFDNPAGIKLIARLLGLKQEDHDFGELEKLIRETVLPDGLVSVMQTDR